MRPALRHRRRRRGVNDGKEPPRPNLGAPSASSAGFGWIRMCVCIGKRFQWTRFTSSKSLAELALGAPRAGAAMSQATCSVCTGTLVQTSPSTWGCRTPDCVGGVQRFTCGFCRAPSFSLRKRSCINPDCRTHGLVREPCPTCNNFSVVTLDGISFCINRGCPAVAGSIGTCPICQTKSLIRTARYTVCVKSTCATLLKPVAFTSITTSPKPVAAPDKPAALAQKVTDRIAKPAASASPDPPSGNAAPDRTPAGPNGTATSKSDEAKPSTQTADDLDPWGMTRGIDLATIPQGPSASPSSPVPPPAAPVPPQTSPVP